MSITVNDKNLGHATAYGYAVSKGFSGTEEEFAELMAGYADVGQRAETSAQIATSKASEASESASASAQSANSASASATTAQTKANEASASAQTVTENANQASAYAITAITKASEASVSASESAQSASDASASASTATTKASEASASATTAETKASEASASANLANVKASEASGSANIASTKASEASQSATASETARTGAETARAGAETAQTGAETAMDLAITAKNEARQSATIATQKADSITGLTATATTLEPNESATANYANGVLTIGVPKGVQGNKGDDGHSPTVTASKSGKVTTISVDDTPIATISDGNDGHSPVITASKSDGTTSISVDGAVVATVDDGVDGNDGHSPVITASKVDGTTSVSVDDVVVATIDDGEKGDKGDEGEIPISAFSKDTASGDIVHIIDGADDIPMDSVKVKIEPVQDLNGQSSPYPAGGGKNLLQTTLTSKTEGGVTFTVNPDGTFSAVGTASQAQAQVIVGTVSLLAGEYIISDGSNFARGNEIEFYVSGVSGASTKGADNARFTLTESVADKNVYFYIAQGTTINATIKPMIRLATETDATFAPYSNICPISGWTGAVVSHSGVNIWDEEWELGGYNINTGEKTVNNSFIRCKNPISVVSGQTYRVTCPTNIFAIGKDKDGNCRGLIKSTTNVSSLANKDILIPSGVVAVCWYSDNYGTTYNHNISINYPSTDHDYHPYTGDTYSITFPSEAGIVYGGELDVTNGTLTVDKAMVDLGTLNWTLNNHATLGNYFYASTSNLNVKYEGSFSTVIYSALCSIYSSARRYQSSFVNGTFCFDGVDITKMVSQLQIKDSNYGNAVDFKAAMSGVQLCYKLATPITYQLTPTEIATLYGENNIYSDCGDISIEYRADATLYMERLISADKSGTTTTLYVKDKPIATISDGAKGDKGDAGDVNLAQLYSILPKDTVSGSVAQIVDGADNVPMDSVKVEIEPVQDLHGQDEPYPAGGKENKMPSPNSITPPSELTVTNDNGVLNINGTVSSTVNIDVYIDPVTFASSGQKLAFLNSFTNATLRLYYQGTQIEYFSLSTTNRVVDESALSAIQGQTIDRYRLQINPQTLTKCTFGLMLLPTATSDTTFIPYSNICPITGWTGVNVVRTGVNVWDEEWEEGSIDTSTGENLNRSGYVRSKNYISVVGGEAYNFHMPWAQMFYYDQNKEFIQTISNGITEDGNVHDKVIAIPSGCYYIRFRCVGSYGTTYNHDISINYPSTDHDYHPYTGNTYAITLPTEAGTVYGGELDLTNGTLTVDKAMVDLGTLNWRYTSAENGRFYMDLPVDAKLLIGVTGSLCSRYAPTEASDWQRILNHEYILRAGLNAVGRCAIAIMDNDYTDPTAFKTAMNGVQFCYELAEPITYTLTPTEIKSLLEDNNIWADAGDTTVEYRADINLYINKKITEVVNALS